MCTHKHTRTHAHTHARTHTRTHARTHTHTHTQSCMQIHMHTYTCTSQTHFFSHMLFTSPHIILLKCSKHPQSLFFYLFLLHHTVKLCTHTIKSTATTQVFCTLMKMYTFKVLDNGNIQSTKEVVGLDFHVQLSLRGTVRDGPVIPGWGVGTRSSYLTLHCHHQSDSVFLGNVTTILTLSSQSLCSSACLEMTQTLFHIARHKTAAPALAGNGVDRLLLSLVRIHNLAWLKRTQALYAIKQGTKQQLPS